jgi:hypothetical protein
MTTYVQDGDWRLEIYTNKSNNDRIGYRRFHLHDSTWYWVVSVISGVEDGVTACDFDERWGWKCGQCGEPVPATMEGYVTLARASFNA